MSRGQRFVSRAAVASVGLVVAASLGACTDGGSPTPPTSAAVSTPVAPTTTAAPTTSAMTDDEAAISAVSSYVKAFNEALQSRSSIALRETHTDGCIPCSAESDKIDALQKAARTIEGGQISLDKPTIVQRINANQFMVEGSLVQTAAKIRDAGGRVVDSFDSAGPKKAYFLVRKDGGLWKVSGLSA